MLLFAVNATNFFSFKGVTYHGKNAAAYSIAIFRVCLQWTVVPQSLHHFSWGGSKYYRMLELMAITHHSKLLLQSLLQSLCNQLISQTYSKVRPGEAFGYA